MRANEIYKCDETYALIVKEIIKGILKGNN